MVYDITGAGVPVAVAALNKTDFAHESGPLETIVSAGQVISGATCAVAFTEKLKKQTKRRKRDGGVF
jgi:hypothetical protein